MVLNNKNIERENLLYNIEDPDQGPLPLTYINNDINPTLIKDSIESIIELVKNKELITDKDELEAWYKKFKNNKKEKKINKASDLLRRSIDSALSTFTLPDKLILDISNRLDYINRTCPQPSLDEVLLLRVLLSDIFKIYEKNRVNIGMLDLITEWEHIAKKSDDNIEYKNIISKKLSNMIELMGYHYYMPELFRLLESTKKEIKHCMDNDKPFVFETVEDLEKYVDRNLNTLINNYLPFVTTKENKDKLRALKENNEYSNIIINSKSDEIQAIINEITSLLPEYYGTEDIKERINKAYLEYKNKISVKNPGGLSLENSDKERVYQTFVYELKTILSELKTNIEENKKYIDMIEYINEWEKILVLDEYRGSDNDISNILYKISSIIISFLKGKRKQEEKIVYAFRSTLGRSISKEESKKLNSEEKSENENKLKDIEFKNNNFITLSNDTSKYLLEDPYIGSFCEFLAKEKEKIIETIRDKNQSSYNSFDEFEKAIRIQLQAFILELNKKVIKSDFINSIKESYESVMKNDNISSNNKYIEFYLKEFKKVVDFIKDNGSIEEKDILNNILNKSINYNQDLSSILKEIQQRYEIIYKMELDIRERIAEAEKDKEYNLHVKI